MPLEFATFDVGEAHRAFIGVNTKVLALQNESVVRLTRRWQGLDVDAALHVKQVADEVLRIGFLVIECDAELVKLLSNAS